MTHKDDKTLWSDTDEPEPTEEELNAARALGDSLDRVLAPGSRRSAPHDELSATALLVQASARTLPLEQRRRDALVEQAITEAGQRRRARRLRWVAPAVVALAASFLLVISGLLYTAGQQMPESPVASPGAVSRQTLSRPSDDLMGRPFKDRAGASSRLDTVFEDRLRGYRLVILAERGQP